jgi:hypothetical protein
MQVSSRDQPGPQLVHVVGPPSSGLGPPTKVDQTRFYRAVHVGCAYPVTPTPHRVIDLGWPPAKPAHASTESRTSCDQPVTTLTNTQVKHHESGRRGTLDPTVKQAS